MSSDFFNPKFISVFSEIKTVDFSLLLSRHRSPGSEAGGVPKGHLISLVIMTDSNRLALPGGHLWALAIAFFFQTEIVSARTQAIQIEECVF